MSHDSNSGLSAIIGRLLSADIWLRALYLIIFALVLKVAASLVILLAVLFWIVVVIRGEEAMSACEHLKAFSGFVRDCVGYLTFQSEQKPFPFKAWNRSGQE
ncbi:DUF4389 domain-containing protein [Pokkaliibacter sp. CJK22405]|uniref:DUF4389 domain-containing protein n=1 Tax=Pokkaliibacter sp. CJK22405 TaxID=3384615 RepID=UPI0039852176